jgi:hypothetical protein
LPYAEPVTSRRPRAAAGAAWWRSLLVTSVLAALALAASAAGAGRTPDGRRASVDPMRERILAHLTLQPGMIVAEIGIGQG